MNTSYIYSDVKISPVVYPLITLIIILGCYGLLINLCINRKRIVNSRLEINRVSPITNNNHNDNNSISKINNGDDKLPSYNEIFN